ncbi:MAG: PqqD family protein [Gemmatimonadales bacterium]
MSVDQYLRVNSPLVVSQEIEGEAILIHFDSGCYYSANATGSAVLGLIARGLRSTEISETLQSMFPGSSVEIQDSVTSFLSEAVREGLLVPATEGSAGAPEPVSASQQVGGPWVAPKLERFDDLQDLLMLDPIHDVDAVGWPVPPPGEDTTAVRG